MARKFLNHLISFLSKAKQHPASIEHEVHDFLTQTLKDMIVQSMYYVSSTFKYLYLAIYRTKLHRCLSVKASEPLCPACAEHY